jgi:ABC-2 type transport system permease protein
MNILTIALKDLKQILRDRMSALFLVIMPLAFTFLMGLLFGGTQHTETRLNVGLINNDPNGALTQTLVGSLKNSNTVKIVDLLPADESTINDKINNGKLAGAMIIPANYSSDLLAEKNPKATIIANPAGTGGQSVMAELQTKVSQLMGALQTAHLSLQAYTAQKPVTDPQAYLLDSVNATLLAWQSPSVSITSEPVTTGASKVGISGYSQTSPGMLFQFAIAGLIGAASVLVLERQNRTVTRMLTAPVSKAEVILGHLLGVTVTVFLQETILILAGQIFFKVNYLQNPLATLLMMHLLRQPRVILWRDLKKTGTSHHVAAYRHVPAHCPGGCLVPVGGHQQNLQHHRSFNPRRLGDGRLSEHHPARARV